MAEIADELRHGAKLFLAELLQLEDGEDLLLYADQQSDSRVAEALKAQAARQGRRVEMLALDARQPIAARAARLAARIRDGHFHAICELTGRTLYLTEAWRVARERDARVYSLAGLDAAAFTRCVGRVDHARMYELGMALRTRLVAGCRLEIRSAGGTDLRMRLGGGRVDRLRAKLLGGPRAFVLRPSGYRGGFLGGQLAFRGIPHTIEGTAVVDGYVWPPDTLGLITEPVVLTFKAGRLVDIGGGATPAKLLAQWLDGVEPSVEHICLGFHPGARLDGGILEAERVFGCVTVGIGRGAGHTDVVLREPSIYLDGRVLQDHGRLLAPELATLARELCDGARVNE